jgi:hypothetical protein
MSIKVQVYGFLRTPETYLVHSNQKVIKVIYILDVCGHFEYGPKYIFTLSFVDV